MFKNSLISILLGSALCLPASPAPSVEPAATSLKAAQAVVGKGGSVSLLIGGRRGPPIRDVAALPAGPIRINEIDLRNSQAVDADLDAVASVTELERLLIIGRPITDAGIAKIAGLRDLTVLEMAETKVSDVGVRHVAGLKKLRGLSLDHTSITDATLKIAGQLPELAVLKVGSTAITDAGLAPVTALKKLDIFQLDGTRISDEGMKHVAKLTSLRQLRLNGTFVTDASVEHFVQLKNLRNLTIVGTAVTLKGYEVLQRDLPGCKIDWRAELVRTSSAIGSAITGLRVEGARNFFPAAIDDYCRGTIPKVLQGGTIYAYAATGPTGPPELGEVRVTAEREMGIFMAACWNYDGPETPDWVNARVEERDPERLGWQLIGALQFAEPGLEPHLVYWKKFRAAETASLRTRRLHPPMIIAGTDPDAVPEPEITTDMHPSLVERMLSSRLAYWLRTEQFAQLEERAAEFRKTKSRSKNGRSFLSVFYDGMTPLAETEEEWQAIQKLYENWEKAYPKSASAKISLAYFWLGYAWFARGSRFGERDDIQQRHYEERLKRAEQLVQATYKLEEKDPYACRVEVHLVIERHGSPEQLEAVLKKSLAIDPNYTATLIDACRYYFINYYGEPGDLEKFADRLVDLTRSTHGEQLYAEVLILMVDVADNRLFVSFKFDWPRGQKALAQLHERFPESAADLAAAVRLYGHAGDRAGAEAALTRLDQLGYAPFEYNAKFERWRSWTQGDLLTGDQKAAFTDVRVQIMRVEWTIDGKHWIALDNTSTLTVVQAADQKLVSRTAHPRHQSRFSAVVPFADVMVSAGWDGQIMYYPPKNAQAFVIGSHEGVTAAALSTDGSQFATCGPDKRIRFWNLEKTDEPPYEWDMAPLNVSALAFIPDSRTLAVGDRENHVGFWNLETRKMAVELTPRRGGIKYLRVSGDGEVLAVVDTREITLWRIKRFEQMATIPLPSQPINDVALSKGGQLLVAATGTRRTKTDCNVIVWNTADGSLRKTLRGHKDIVRSVCFSPDGKQIASASDDMTIRLWSAE